MSARACSFDPPPALQAALDDALAAVRRARSRRQRHVELDEAEVHLLAALAIAHGQNPERARRAAAAALASERWHARQAEATR